MGYVEAKIASKDDVVAAARDGIEVTASVEYDEFAAGWRLDVLFTRDSQLHSFHGRMFRAASKQIAAAQAQKQLDRILGAPRAAGHKFSDQYQSARKALETKIQQVWDIADRQSEPDLIEPGPIKFDWKMKQPKLKVWRLSNVSRLEQKYAPEFAEFCRVGLKEINQE